MTGGSFQRLVGSDAVSRGRSGRAADVSRCRGQQWNIPMSSCRTTLGVVSDGSGRKLTYGQLAAAAAKLPPPTEVKLKAPDKYAIIGKPLKRLDTPEKCNGRAVFGIDVKLPDMLVAVVARPPIFGATVKSFDDSKARNTPACTRLPRYPRALRWSPIPSGTPRPRARHSKSTGMKVR